jgi:hypothetical protein
VLLALAGLLMLLIGLRPLLDSYLLLRIGIWPEMALGLVGLFLLVRAFRSPLAGGHRIGLGLVGCSALLPFLLFAGLVALFSLGANHDRQRDPPVAQNRN